MRRIVFFDVDGTLLTKGQTEVPESTAKAMEKLRAQDIGICLCTGRHPIELRQLGLLKYSFDGYVLLNGQLVLDKNMNIISARTIEDHDKAELLGLFEKKIAPMILVEKDRLFMNFHNVDVEKVQRDIASPVYEIGEYNGADIFMSTIFVPRGEEPKFTNLTAARWHDLAMDIYLPDGGKIYGIRRMLKRVCLTEKDVIAFGDGDNDIEMLRLADLGIAMGNAPDNVKVEADYITDPVDQDGIWNALVKFGII